MEKPTRQQIEDLIREQAELHGLDVELCRKQCQAESNWDQGAVSSCGAIGLFQLMPATAKGLRVDPYDWRQNIIGALGMVKNLMVYYQGDKLKTYCAYNWGAGNLLACTRKYLHDWPRHIPDETKGYVKKILGIDVATVVIR